jgi:hypothetical protein
MNDWQGIGIGMFIVCLAVGAFLLNACGYINIKPKNTKQQVAENIYAGILFADIKDDSADTQAKEVLLRLDKLIDVALVGERAAGLGELLELVESELPPTVDKKLFKAVQVLLVTNMPTIEPTAELKTHLAGLEDISEIIKLVLGKLNG